MMPESRVSHRADRIANCALGLILCLPSFYFLWNFPPFWRDSDGFYQVTGKPSYLTLLHWPPLYCLTARIPIWVGDAVVGRFSGKLVLADAGVETLIVVQHALLVSALYFACVSMTMRRLLRILIAGYFASTPWLYAFANCVGSEAYSNVFVVLTAIYGWRAVRDPDLNPLEVLCWLGALAGAILSRHINTILVLLLPGTMLLALLLERVVSAFGGRHIFLQWRALIPVFGLSVVAVIACQLVTFALCGIYKVPFRSRVGYVFQWRLDYLGSLSPDQRNARLERVANKLNDRSVTYAVRQVESALGEKAGWQPELLSQAIYRWFESNTHGSFGQRSAAMDARLNAIAGEFLWSGDPALYGQIGRDFIASLQFAAPDITKEPFLATDWLNGFLADPVFQPVKHLKTFQDRSGSSLDQFARAPYCQLWRGVPLWAIGTCGLSLAVGLMIRRSFSSNSLVRDCYLVLLICTGLLICLANCTLTFLAPRFTPSVAILFQVACCIALGEHAEIGYLFKQDHVRPTREDNITR
jgi:hypothetical protein